MPKSPDMVGALAQFAGVANCCLIASEDTDDQDIVFAIATHEIFDWEPEELFGRPITILLPPEVRGRHRALMQGFKKKKNASTPSQMSARAVPGVKRGGDLVSILISISYHPGTPGLFVAAIRLADHEDSPELRTELENIQSMVFKLLTPAEKAARLAWAKITAWLAAGGLSTVLVFGGANVKPLTSAVQAFFSAWQQKSEAPHKKIDVAIVPALDDRIREGNLTLIREILRRNSKAILAVGYYRLEKNVSGARLQYVSDSGSPTGEEVWFFDAESEGFAFTEQDGISLKRGDCILKKKGASILPTKQLLDTIICPTLSVVADERSPQLEKFQVQNAIAVAGTFDKLEPTASWLFEFAPSVEKVYR